MNIQQLRAQIAALQVATMDENRNFCSAYDEGKFDALSAVDALLDSLQEEPVSEQKLSNVGRTVKDRKEKSVSDIDFEQELYKAFGHVKDFTLGMQIAKWFYDMGRKYHEPVSEDFEKIVEEIAEPTILNAYGTKELARRLRNTICGTSVSEDLEEASKEWLRPQLDKSYANYGETKMMELTHFDGYAMLDAIEFGANWQKQKDSIPVSEDLEKAAVEAFKQIVDSDKNNFLEIFKAGAHWQKEQMMKDAIEAEIINWASMFTSIKVIEPERAETMIKEKFDIGDKVKLIIVKEE